MRRSHLQAAEAAEDSAQAARTQRVEAEGPEVGFLKIAMERAKKLYSQGLIASNALEEADQAYQMACTNRRRPCAVGRWRKRTGKSEGAGGTSSGGAGASG